MFILRRITSNNLECNTVLGESYNLVHSERDPEEFEKTMKLMQWDNDEDVYGFVIYSSGSKQMPLYKKSHYFVMCSNGETFANISFKKL